MSTCRSGYCKINRSKFLVGAAGASGLVAARSAEAALIGTRRALIGSPYAALVMQSKPIAFYQLNEPVGSTVAQDSSGNGLAMTYGSSVTLGQSSIIAGQQASAFFNGSVGLPYMVYSPARVPALELATFISFECWIDTFAINGGSIPLGYGTSGAGFIWGFVQGSTPTQFSSRVTSNGTSYSAVSNIPVQISPLYMASTYDGANLRLYFNGQLAATAAVSGPINGYSSSDTYGFCINGKSDVSQSAGNIALIQNVAVYATPLSAATIAAHYAAGINN